MSLVGIVRYVVRCDGHGCGAAWASEAPGETYLTPTLAQEAADRLGFCSTRKGALCPKCQEKEAPGK